MQDPRTGKIMTIRNQKLRGKESKLIEAEVAGICKVEHWRDKALSLLHLSLYS